MAQIPLRTRQASQWHRFASGHGRSQTGEARAGWVVDHTDNRGCRQRKHSQTKKAADFFRIKIEGVLGAGSGGYRAKPCWGEQPLTSRAAIACVKCEEDFEEHVGYAYDTAGTPPEHILAADCRDLASTASPPACPFLGCRRCGVRRPHAGRYRSLFTLNGFARCNRCRCTKKRP